MKQLSAIALLSILLVLSLRDAGTYLAFRYNRAWIVENKCENQSRPAMKCNGACYLRKIIVEESGTDNPLPRQVVEEWEIVFYAVPRKLREGEGMPAPSGHLVMLSDVRFNSDPHLRQVFHPPRPWVFRFANG